MAVCIAAIFSSVACAQSWTSIASQSHRYFRYGRGESIENRIAHSRDLRFQKGPAPARTVCPLENRSGVYWFSPDGRPLNGTFVTPSPSEFTVSPLEKNIRGFAFTGAFAGSAAGKGSALEVVYFTDRECSDGGLEFGFSRDLGTNNVLVYWASYANCGNGAASLCRKTDDPSLGANDSNVQQENGGISARHGFRIYGLAPDGVYTWRIFAGRGALRVEVLKDGVAARCSEREGSPLAPCSFTEAVESWFPIDRIRSGYIVAGTQTAGDPEIRNGVLSISDILVAR